MLQQVVDLREEGDQLHELIRTLHDGDWERHTAFKNWTINDVIAHLHFSDRLAVMSVKDEQGLLKLSHELAEAMLRGQKVNFRELAHERLGHVRGHELGRLWRDFYLEMCDLLGSLDPRARLKWFGPDMSVPMFATARQMETWAHGQEIYDLLRIQRKNTDRIRNIAHIGVKTFGWTFVNRGIEVPGEVPYVRLTAPSGEIWEWNEPDEQNRIQGSAVDFCHVATQGRNIADVPLTVVGETARRWMEIAQCFAGGPEDPPKHGERVPK